MVAASVKEKGTESYPFRKRTVPAWLMSVGLHSAVLLVAGWLFAPEITAPRFADRDRRGEIVLVPERKLSGESRPLTGADDGRMDSEVIPASAETPADQSLAAEALESTLPPLTLAPTLPAVQLPAQSGVIAGNDQLVATPGGLAGRGRPQILPGIHEAEILAQEAAREREPAPRGTPANLTLFGVPSTGRSFVFVIDRSESMGRSGVGAIDAAAHELQGAIEALSGQQFFQVIAYNESATIHARRELMPATSGNKTELIEFVRRLSAFGGTEHIYGLQAALKLKPEVIYLFTDGGDPIPNGLQRRTIRELAAGRTQIHCLHFSGERASPAAEFFQQLTRENGGTYALVPLK